MPLRNHAGHFICWSVYILLSSGKFSALAPVVILLDSLLTVPGVFIFPPLLLPGLLRLWLSSLVCILTAGLRTCFIFFEDNQLASGLPPREQGSHLVEVWPAEREGKWQASQRGHPKFPGGLSTCAPAGLRRSGRGGGGTDGPAGGKGRSLQH